MRREESTGMRDWEKDLVGIGRGRIKEAVERRWRRGAVVPSCGYDPRYYRQKVVEKEDRRKRKKEERPRNESRIETKIECKRRGEQPG